MPRLLAQVELVTINYGITLSDAYTLEGPTAFLDLLD